MHREVTMDGVALILAGHEHWAEHGGEWWPIFPLFWILFAVGLVYFISRRKAHYRRNRSRYTGQSVLAERYAKGEIDEREYRDRLEVLKNVAGS